MRYRAEITEKEQLPEAIAIGSFEYVYAPMEFLKVNTPEKERIIAVPPVFLGGNESAVAEHLRKLREWGFTSALAHTLGHIELIKSVELIKSAGLTPRGGFRLNITNSIAQRKYEESGLADGIFSVELSRKSISVTERGIPMGIMAYGHMPMMIMRRCPVRDDKPCGKNGCNKLTDRQGKIFRTYCRYEEVEILNPEPIVLSDTLADVSADFIVLRFTKGDNITRILREYEQGAKHDGKFTRGLFYKKVK